MNKHPNKLPIWLLILLLSNVSLVGYTKPSQLDTAVEKALSANSKDERNIYLQQIVDYYYEKYEKNNTNLDSIINLGKAYLLLGNQSEAKHILMQGYSLYGNNPKAQKALADYYYHFQEYNTALEFYKLALSSGFLRNVETNLATAKCYEKLGDSENAVLYYKIVLKLDPKQTGAKEKIETISSLKPVNYQSINELFIPIPDDDQNLDEEIENLIDNLRDLQ